MLQDIYELHRLVLANGTSSPELRAFLELSQVAVQEHRGERRLLEFNLLERAMERVEEVSADYFARSEALSEPSLKEEIYRDQQQRNRNLGHFLAWGEKNGA
ncbi:MAG: hypothetical protein HQL56_18325 [Magnetococcales bacterium]|nr:hypothetical protein [Magnetococcales bacterium]